MITIQTAVIGILTTVGLALMAYIIAGSRGWGQAMQIIAQQGEAIKDLQRRMEAFQHEVATGMIRQKDLDKALESAVLQLKLDMAQAFDRKYLSRREYQLALARTASSPSAVTITDHEDTDDLSKRTR